LRHSPPADLETAMTGLSLHVRAAGWAVAAAIAIAPLSSSAQQQSAGGAGAPPKSGQAGVLSAATSPESDEHLFGDWWGVRPYLHNLGIDYSLDYTTESGWNPVGGLRQGVAYAHQFGLEVDADWQKLAGITGFSTHLAVVNRAGVNLSSYYIGDNVIQAQEIWGAGFGVGVHAVWLYGEQKLFGDRFDAVFGRIFPGMDFAASPLYCSFMTLTICGHPRALTAEQGFIDWPSNTWGGRVRVRPTSDTYLMGGVYASQPFPGGGMSGWDWSTNQVTGAYWAGEAAWEPSFGSDHLQGHYKIGIGYDTSSLASNAFVFTGSPPNERGRAQWWITFDQMLFRNGPGPNRGLTLLGAYAHDAPGNSFYENFVWAGLLYSGFWSARPDDQIGLAFTYYQVSPELNRTESLEQAFDFAPTYPYGVQNHGMVLEANYNFPIWRGVQVQPEVEYFIQPGGVSTIRDTLVLGVKTHVLF
jgi:porin